ncbi:hypothetical protein CPB84DRAFT_1689182 [Gymnopilus junonius]|uniref:Uncharacterized protein n=1 Tax=Gymnopilus junonius TaxID=109634 RepID=A0A9P5NAQ8_GYMJU|nr:hypothetical protein CPB84DRAFT_1689182 [Gymnopilus junonius]
MPISTSGPSYRIAYFCPSASLPSLLDLQWAEAVIQKHDTDVINGPLHTVYYLSVDLYPAVLAYIKDDHIQELLKAHIAMAAPSIELQREIYEHAPLFAQYKTRGNAIVQDQAELKELFHCLWNQVKQSSAQASHAEKRHLVQQLGIRQKIGSILDNINSAASFQEAARTVLDQFGFHLILRQRLHSSRQKQDFPGEEKYHDFHKGYLLVEEIFEDTPAEVIRCTPEEGYMDINPSESAVIVSGNLHAYRIELVVVCNVPKNSNYTAPLFEWLTEVVHTACYNWRNPTHPGQMVQIGLNMGARHARVLGWAKSFSRNLTENQKFQQDVDLLGSMSLLWATVKSHIPQDITGKVQEKLDAGFPSMATRNIPEGCGFDITISGHRYAFSEAARAPPEGYATAGYQAHSHTDLCSLKWAFSWTVGRTGQESSPFASHKNGANFADLPLKVVVKNAVGTLLAFQPEELHGTTEKRGVINYQLSLTSTQRVAEAYVELESSGAGIAFAADMDDHKYE